MIHTRPSPLGFMPTNESLGRTKVVAQAGSGPELELHRPSVVHALLFDSTGCLERGLHRAAEVLGQSKRLRVLRADEVSQETTVDLIVWEQLTPAAGVADEYERWHRRFPLARFVTVWGPWCIGGFRNGFPLSGENYVTWLVWPWQVQCFLRQWFSDQATLWDLPRTAGLAERVGRAALAYERDPMWGPVSIDLISADADLAEALTMACKTLGWSVTRFQSVNQRQASLRQPGTADRKVCRQWIWAPSAGSPEAGEAERANPSGSGIELLAFAESTLPETNHSAHDSLEVPAAELTRRVILPQPFLLAELQAAVRDLCF